MEAGRARFALGSVTYFHAMGPTLFCCKIRGRELRNSAQPIACGAAQLAAPREKPGARDACSPAAIPTAVTSAQVRGPAAGLQAIP